jgi:hypothetical protein
MSKRARVGATPWMNFNFVWRIFNFFSFSLFTLRKLQVGFQAVLEVPISVNSDSSNSIRRSHREGAPIGVINAG